MSLWMVYYLSIYPFVMLGLIRRVRTTGKMPRKPKTQVHPRCTHGRGGESDKTKMNFGSGGNMKSKAWRDIWGSGQGIGQIADAPPVAELVERLKFEFTEASSDFLNRARA